MATFCELCDVKIPQNASLEEHNLGKKHLAILETQNHLKAIANRSIYLSNFQRPVNISAIESALLNYGQIDRVITNKQNHNFAIVEFKEEEVAQSLLNSMAKIQIDNVCFSV